MQFLALIPWWLVVIGFGVLRRICPGEPGITAGP